MALVARRQERLETLVDELKSDGIDAAAFVADLSDPGNVSELIERITDRFGEIDVVAYGPLSAYSTLTPATDVTPATIENIVGVSLLTPIETVRVMLPRWLERGDGTFLLTSGITAAVARPGFSGLPIVGAAARHYVETLHGELAETGVYTGILTVNAGIAGSEMSEAVAQATPDDERTQFPVVDPAELADICWDMYVTRDRVDITHPPVA